MDIPELLAFYDADVRARPGARPGLAVERVDGVVRLVGQFNFVCWWDFTDEGAPAAVARQAAHFRSLGEPLLWRVHDHDRPTALPDLLARNGFRPDPPGTLMVFDLADELASGAAPGVEVRQARSPTDVADFATAADRAFGDTQASERSAVYAAHLDNPDLALFVAYLDAKPVASARLETTPGQAFGQLFGGGVAPEHRGLGAYRALVQARAEEARRRGLRYLSIEARETSRPILQRLGFVAVGRETTWVLPPDASAA